MTALRKTCVMLIGALALTSAHAAAQTEEANAILGQAGSSVLALVTYGPDKAEILKGSALALSEDIVVTAYHVVSQASDIEGLNIKGKKVKIEGILGIDKAHDLALLKLKGKLTALPVGSVDSLAAGSKLFALGSNESGQVVLAEGTFRRTVDLGAAGKILEVSIPCPEQFRGGPLVDINGQLIGMLFVGDRNLKFGLPINTLVAVPSDGESDRVQGPDQGELLRDGRGELFRRPGGHRARRADDGPGPPGEGGQDRSVRRPGAPPAGRHMRPAEGLRRGCGRLPQGHRARSVPGRSVLRPGNDPVQADAVQGRRRGAGEGGGAGLCRQGGPVRPRRRV